MTRWLPKDAQAWWDHEIETGLGAAKRIEATAQVYDRQAAEIQSYAPDIASEQRDWANWERQRAARVRERCLRIRDYLNGKIDLEAV